MKLMFEYTNLKMLQLHSKYSKQPSAKLNEWNDYKWVDVIY